jgi:hypothetical protein
MARRCEACDERRLLSQPAIQGKVRRTRCSGSAHLYAAPEATNDQGWLALICQTVNQELKRLRAAGMMDLAPGEVRLLNRQRWRSGGKARLPSLHAGLRTASSALRPERGLSPNTPGAP